MFTGRWVTSDAIQINEFVGTIELGLGHFGPDLVGVARLYDPLGRPYAPCPCAIVESRGVYIGAGAFTAVSDNCGLSTWLWNLVIDSQGDVSLLQGDIASGDVDDVPVVFEQVDAFVEESFKACEP